MKTKYLQVIGKRTKSRAIYNLTIAVSIRMGPWGNGASLEIIYDLENPKKNARFSYSFRQEGHEELYNSHVLKVTHLMESDDEFLTLELPQL